MGCFWLRLTGLLLVAWLIAPVDRALAQQDTWTLTNARVETVTRGVIERGTIVIRNGLIAAVGADLSPPAEARVLDLSGRTVYPGLIDLTSTLGLVAPPAAAQAGPGAAQLPAAAAAPAYVGVEPQRRVADELRLQATDLRALRDAGITAVLVAPARGAWRGLSALVPLRDSATSRHVIRSPVALHVGFEGVQGRYPSTLLGVIAFQRQMLYDARRHAFLIERYRANPRGVERPAYDPQLEALVPVVRGELPAFVAASNEREVRRALNFAGEFGLQLTIVGATEGFRATDALAAARRAVVVSVDFPRPPDVTGWSYRFSQRRPLDDSASADSAARRLIEGNAAALMRAGIRFALASGGLLRPGEFLANVRKAIAAGLPRDTALAALTIRPAEIAGVGEQLGSIEAGKIANLVVTENDLLGDSARVRMVFVDGIRYEVTPATARADTSRREGRPGPDEAPPVAIAGTWDLTVNSPQGAVQTTMTVTQSGAAFSGSMTNPAGGSVEIADGRLSGRTATWSISIVLGGQTIVASFTGEVEGNRMRGTAMVGEFGTSSFTGEKRP